MGSDTSDVSAIINVVLRVLIIIEFVMVLYAKAKIRLQNYEKNLRRRQVVPFINIVLCSFNIYEIAAQLMLVLRSCLSLSHSMA